MEQLIKGKTKDGKYYVRPINWAGEWDKDGVLVYGNNLIETETEDEATSFMMNYKLIEFVKENPSMKIVPVTYYEVLGGDNGYWLGHIESIEIREYAINKWGDDNAVVFKDDDYKKLVESIAEWKYDGSDKAYKTAEKEVEEMWEKGIIIRIGL